jgi:hypothetical protein
MNVREHKVPVGRIMLHEAYERARRSFTELRQAVELLAFYDAFKVRRNQVI